jgi:hypothetical protein
MSGERGGCCSRGGPNGKRILDDAGEQAARYDDQVKRSGDPVRRDAHDDPLAGH